MNRLTFTRILTFTLTGISYFKIVQLNLFIEQGYLEGLSSEFYYTTEHDAHLLTVLFHCAHRKFVPYLVPSMAFYLIPTVRFPPTFLPFFTLLNLYSKPRASLTLSSILTVKINV